MRNWVQSSHPRRTERRWELVCNPITWEAETDAVVLLSHLAWSANSRPVRHPISNNRVNVSWSGCLTYMCIFTCTHFTCTHLHPKIISLTTIYEPVFSSDQQSSWKEWFKLNSNFCPSFLALLESFSGSCVCLSILIFLTLQGGIFSLCFKVLHWVLTSASALFFNKPSSWSFLFSVFIPKLHRVRDMICLLTQCPFTDY